LLSKYSAGKSPIGVLAPAILLIIKIQLKRIIKNGLDNSFDNEIIPSNAGKININA